MLKVFMSKNRAVREKGGIKRLRDFDKPDEFLKKKLSEVDRKLKMRQEIH